MAPRVLQYSDVEGAYDDPERIGRLAGCIDAVRDDDTLVVGTGDNTAPGVLALVTGGRQALDFFEAVGPDAETLGNHDFDHGLDGTRDLVADSPQPWVCANIHNGDGRSFGADAGVVPSTTVDCDGATVGFTGAITPDVTSMSPPASDLTVEDPVTAVAREVDRLRDDGADYVVVLSHVGRGDDRLASDTDADAVLGGHVHTRRVDTVDGTLCTRPSSGGQDLVEVDLASGTATTHDVGEAPVDEAVAEALRAREAEADLGEVIAQVEDPIRRERSVRFEPENRVGTFVADAYRWAADADVGLQNSGGIREGPPLAGDVTVADVVGLVPFEEPVAVVELTGRELRQVVAEAYGPRCGLEPDMWNGNATGLCGVWDDDDERVVSLTVGGESVDDADTYTVATSDYLLHSTHEFPTLTERHRVDTLGLQYEVLVAYARKTGIDVERDGRFVRR